MRMKMKDFFETGIEQLNQFMTFIATSDTMKFLVDNREGIVIGFLSVVAIVGFFKFLDG